MATSDASTSAQRRPVKDRFPPFSVTQHRIRNSSSCPIADACKRRSPMFVLSAALNGMLMATGDGAKDCEMARASFWLPDRERSIIWRYLDGLSLALANMFRLPLAPECASICGTVLPVDRH